MAGEVFSIILRLMKFYTPELQNNRKVISDFNKVYFCQGLPLVLYYYKAETLLEKDLKLNGNFTVFPSLA